MTKLAILFFLIFYHSSLFSQYIVLDKITKKPIEYVSVDFLNGDGTFTNNKGEFSLKQETLDSIKLSCIGYKTLIYDLDKKSPIYLEKNIHSIEEVLLVKKKVKQKVVLKHNASNLKKLLTNRGFIELRPSGIGVTYIPYPDYLKNSKPIITKLIVSTSDINRYKSRKHWPFKVNLYKAKQGKLPPLLKDSLLTGIITKRTEGEEKTVINVKDEKLPFTQNGIYISFETLPDKFYPESSGICKEYREFNKAHDGEDIKTTMIGYGAVPKTIKINPKKARSVSYYIEKNKLRKVGEEQISPYWEQKKYFIYDLTIEIEY